MRVSPIAAPLPSEHVSATSPILRPEVEAAWQRRLNYWTGRALTVDALEQEQEERAARLAWRGRQVSAGVVRGLEVSLEAGAETAAPSLLNHFLHVLPGHAFALTGEDVVVPRPMTLGAQTIPVRQLNVNGEWVPLRPDPPPVGGVQAHLTELEQAWGADPIAANQPWAAVLVLEPVTLINVDRSTANDPCEIDPESDAFSDPRILDAARLRWYLLPPALLPAIDAANPPFNLAWRNRVATGIFERELAAPATPAPWQAVGVPIALLSFRPGTNPGTFLPYVDLAVVTRPGGRPRERLRPGRLLGDPALPAVATLWQQRYAQFVEHLSQLPAAVATNPSVLAQHFRSIPPAGILPKAALDILTTPTPPTLLADRASLSRFFPTGWRVEAAPIPIEDLDAALGGSTPLAPLDLSGTGEIVRFLVPVPERVYEPELLVVAQPDPRIEAERRRLLGIRQDWRQRRDWVLGRRNDLHRIIVGPTAPALPPPADPPNQEVEPVETVARVGLETVAFDPGVLPRQGFDTTLLPPAARPANVELTVSFPAKPLGTAAFLYVELRPDYEFPPVEVVIRWRAGAATGARAFATPPPPLPIRLGAQGEELDTPTWLRYAVAPVELGFTSAQSITGFTLEIHGGAAAVARAGVIRTSNLNLGIIWWRAGEPNVQSTPGPWDRVSFDRLVAPFESRYKPAFAEGPEFEDRLHQIALDARLGAPIESRGLEPLRQELDTRADKADDLISLSFYKTQAHIHRIRQVMLGEDAANDLLTSPSLNNVVKAKSSRISQERLTQIFLNADRVDPPHPAAGGPGPAAAGPFAAQAVFTTGTLRTLPTAAPLVQTFALNSKLQAAATKDDILQSEPVVGQNAPIRSVTIGKRFASGVVNDAYNNALGGLREVTGLVRTLALSYADSEEFPRPVVGSGTVTKDTDIFGSVKFRNFSSDAAVALNFLPIFPVDNPAKILAKALEITDASAAILRRLEFYVAQLRQLTGRIQEAIDAARAQRDAAVGRLATIDARLTEARHDVAVARALQQEDRDTVRALNLRRDTILQEHVKFLAYIRPRNLDLAERLTPTWDLDSAVAAAPLPECLRRHDDPPDPLEAYLRLFRHAPARWFTAIGPRLREFDTRERLLEVLQYAQASALRYATEQSTFTAGAVPTAVRAIYQGGSGALGQLRQHAATLNFGAIQVKSWSGHVRDVEEHVALGDIIDGRHANGKLAADAATELGQIQQVATCLHAEFASVPPAVRLNWVERYSEFDAAGSFRDLTHLPEFGRLERHARRRLQAFTDWLFSRVAGNENGAEALINDLVRLCLLLASHAPVDRIITGHLPRLTPVRIGNLIPIRPVEPARVRVGMDFHVWQDQTLVARGKVVDLHDGEVSASVEHTLVSQLQTTVRVQFIPAAFRVGG